MKGTLTICFLLVATGTAAAGTIPFTVSSARLMVFASAWAGDLPPSESLILTVPAGLTGVVLHLGNYSAADVGLTRILTPADFPAGELELAMAAARSNGDGIATPWLGTTLASVWGVQGAASGLGDPFRIFNLQEFGVTIESYSSWTDSGNTFRRADVKIASTWIIPEPATVGVALVGAAVLFGVRSRRRV